MNLLLKTGINFYAGVPDSLLQGFSACLEEHGDARRHIVAANEGNAAALAAGYHLATGEIGLVYLQNSGLGNIVNPLLSLLAPEAYAIPVLFLIGWRGEPGKKDEPQHIKQGQLTLPLLETLGVNYALLPGNEPQAVLALEIAMEEMRTTRAPYALVVCDNILLSENISHASSPGGPAGKEPSLHIAGEINIDFSEGIDEEDRIKESDLMTRESALQIILSALEPNAAVVSTTGKLSREVYDYQKKHSAGLERFFLNVGAMGHTSQIALGIALSKPGQIVYCLDGDGAALMHMGALAVIGATGATNYRHIIFNNGAHDSVGGQPTVGWSIDFPGIAKACGYRWALRIASEQNLRERLDFLTCAQGPALLEVMVTRGARDKLPRPSETLLESKESFMKFLHHTV